MRKAADIVPPHPLSSLLNRVLEDLARPELGLRACLDLHRLAGARIAPRGGLPASNGEIAEADEAHLVTALQGRGNDLEHRFNGSHCVVAAEPRAVGDMADQFLLVHAPSSPSPAARLERAERQPLRQESASLSSGCDDQLRVSMRDYGSLRRRAYISRVPITAR